MSWPWAAEVSAVREMTLLEAGILGVVQGITEFLPVSSSGHLVLARHALGLQGEALLFDAVVHFGSLVAIVWVFRRELLQMLSGLRPGEAGAEAAGGRRLLGLVVLATLPLVGVGLLARGWVAQVFGNPLVVPAMLVVTALLLVVSERLGGGRAGAELTVRRAAWVGLAQVLAVLPGLSRSGATIAGGMLAGLDRERATRFSFLLAIPAILGVTLLEGARAFRGGLPGIAGAEALVVGLLASGVSTWWAVVLFLRFVRGRALTPFAFYCVAVAVVLLVVRPW